MNPITAKEAVEITNAAYTKELNMELISNFIKKYYIFESIESRAVCGLGKTTIQSENLNEEFSIKVNILV